LDSPGIDGARRIAVNAQPADEVGPNLAIRTPFISLGWVVSRVVVFAARPAESRFSLGRSGQKLEFGLAQLAEAGLRQNLEVVNRSPRTLRHHRHLLQHRL